VRCLILFYAVHDHRVGIVLTPNLLVHWPKLLLNSLLRPTGLSSGPVVAFDGWENGGTNHAVVISPATHFKGILVENRLQLVCAVATGCGVALHMSWCAVLQ
jgi:hypothetical protein